MFQGRDGRGGEGAWSVDDISMIDDSSCDDILIWLLLLP